MVPSNESVFTISTAYGPSVRSGCALGRKCSEFHPCESSGSYLSLPGTLVWGSYRHFQGHLCGRHGNRWVAGSDQLHRRLRQCEWMENRECLQGPQLILATPLRSLTPLHYAPLHSTPLRSTHSTPLRSTHSQGKMQTGTRVWAVCVAKGFTSKALQRPVLRPVISSAICAWVQPSRIQTEPSIRTTRID